MANFHKHPGLERISGRTITVQGESITIGLWGYKESNGKELIVTNNGDDLAIFQVGTQGNSTIWKISVKQSSRTHMSSVKDRILCITDRFEEWDHFDIVFNFKTAEAAKLEARCIITDMFG